MAQILNIYSDGGCAGNQNDKNLGGWERFWNSEITKKSFTAARQTPPITEWN